jgi:hypothetical protein
LRKIDSGNAEIGIAFGKRRPVLVWNELAV